MTRPNATRQNVTGALRSEPIFGFQGLDSLGMNLNQPDTKVHPLDLSHLLHQYHTHMFTTLSKTSIFASPMLIQPAHSFLIKTLSLFHTMQQDAHNLQKLKNHDQNQTLCPNNNGTS